ncbi:MAG: molecular chaperone HtpG [Candidatus Absconditabacteria bacterium]
MKKMTESTKQTYEFQAEVSQLLQLLTHSIYSNKEIFLRELIANANDAIDKARIKSLTDSKYLGDDTSFKISIDVDEEGKTITIKDNGIGMNKEELVNNIGTIAKSGTKEFIEKLKEKTVDNNLIGQFGVGFYSVFMVADKVKVETKSNESDKSYIWISEGKGTFELQEGTKTTRGTEITIILKEEENSFASESRIKGLIKKYSNYVPVEIQMLEDKNDENKDKERKYETVNETKSIWTKNKNDITNEQYNEYYSSLSYDFQAPLGHIHLDVEGMISYKALLFIPSQKSMFNTEPTENYGPKLYVKNILILDACKELLPNWLRFIKGVVETADLPLNISREMLQDNRVLSKIKATLTKNIITKLGEIAKDKNEEYLSFLNNYGNVLKEGIYFDHENQESIAGLMRYYSLKENKYISFDDYIDKKIENQKEIFFLTGSSINEMKNSPYLEIFKEKGLDVLLMSDPIDEYVVMSLPKYKELNLVSAASDNVDLGTSEEEKKEIEKIEQDYSQFLNHVKTVIGEEKIEQVKISNRLKETIGVLVTKDGTPSAQMEKIMKAMNQYMPGNKRIFQLNEKNEIVKAMLNEFNTNKDSDKLKDLILFSYDQALLNEGQGVEDLQAFLTRLNKFAKSYL